MSDQLKKYSLLCPFCKDTINFEITQRELQSLYSSGLAKITIDPHGNPLHIIDVYIDQDELIRGAFPIFGEIETKVSLQNHYITDATSEILPQTGRVQGVTIVPFTISVDNGPLRNYNEEIFFPEVYQNYKIDKKVRSEPVSVDCFLNAFRSAPDNKPIITLLISKRYSEGYNNAVKAKEVLRKENPTKAENVHLIDTKTTGPMMKLMMNKALEMDEEGQSLQEILEYMNWICDKHISFIYVDSLNSLRKSERVGRVTTFFGNLLGLKPIIIENENNNGDLKAFKTVRSKKDAIREITKAIRDQFGYIELIGVIFYGIVIEDAKELFESLNTDSRIEDNDFTLDFIGTGVAIHLSYDLFGISLYPKL